jgi:hypothetical protein
MKACDAPTPQARVSNIRFMHDDYYRSFRTASSVLARAMRQTP